jgi:uncharacterized membrane protein YGL010W
MPMDEYLRVYEAAHRHPVNQATHAVGIPLIVASLVAWIWVPWWAAVAMFVVGWIFQFIGHAAEGNSPKFFQGPVYLLIGPLWVVLKALALVGLYRLPKPGEAPE